MSIKIFNDAPELDHWVIIADASRARVFACDATLEPLVQVRTLSRPDARLRNRELESDLPGRTRGGTHLVGAVTPTYAATHQSLTFARQLATTLEQGAKAGLYQKLVVVAPPSFLGQLRPLLSPAVRRAVVAELIHDFTNHPEQELSDRLRRHLAEDAR